MDHIAPALDAVPNGGTAVSAKPYATSSAEVVSHWYNARQGRYWCIANLVNVTLATSAMWGSVAMPLTLAWAVFLTLNAVLYFATTELKASPKGAMQTSDSIANPIFAAVFGAAWGAALLIAAPIVPASNFANLQLIVLVTAAIGVPVFSLQRGAYPAFIIALAATGLAALWSGSGNSLASTTFAVTLCVLFIAAAYFAHTQRLTNRLLSRYLALGGGDFSVPSSDVDALLSAGEKRFRKLARLLPERDRSHSCLDVVGEAIVTTNQYGEIDYLNPIAEVLTGICRANALGKNIGSIVRLKDPHDQQALEETALSFQTDSDATQIKREAELVREDGLSYQVAFQIAPIVLADGKIVGATFVFSERVERTSLAKEAQWRATHDPLTKLINRVEFEGRLDKLLSTDSADSVPVHHALCIIDLDKFQFMNETYGHRCGDSILQALAAEFAGKIRGADTLARVGDKRFAVLLYGCPTDKARMIAEGLRRIAEETRVDHKDTEVRITVSVGVVEIAPGDDSLTEILFAADTAISRSKQSGGNRVYVFRSDDEDKTSRNHNVSRVRQIQTALHDNDLELYFQNVQAAYSESTRAASCEVVARMRDEKGQVIVPRDAIIMAERFQLMPEIDQWTTKAALDALRVDHPTFETMETIFINLSGQSLNNDSFLNFLISELDDDDVPTEKICFQVSEISLIASIERACFFIATLKDFGCKVALSDFGLATNSFELLKRLQIDYLKIDAQYVRSMAYNSVDYEIVLALSRIAKTLRIQTIAEGVSTLATKDSLVGMGIDYVQGFLVDGPKAVNQTDTRH